VRREGLLPGAAGRPDGRSVIASVQEMLAFEPVPRFSPEDLAEVLGVEAPTPQQAAVIGAGLAPGLVVAGAGAGKTATMASRVVWLVANGLVLPEQVLGLTFTRKAAAELSIRVRHRLAVLHSQGLLDEAAAGEPTVSTYHSYAARLFADHALREGLEPSTRLITPAVQWQLATRVVTDYDGPMDAVTLTPPFVVEAVLGLAGEMAEHLVAPATLAGFGTRLCARIEALPGKVAAAVGKVATTDRGRRQLLALVEAYGEVKRQQEVMDYGDQVAHAAVIAARHPMVGQIERSRYAAVFLDEYQDTGHAQRVLLASLFGDGHPVTAVGDPCQSIYGWRGASASGLRRFPEHFPQADRSLATVRHLTTSFRNGEHILAVANRLSEPLRAEGLDVPVLDPADAGRGQGRVVCALHTTVLDEADWVGEQVAGLLAGGETRPADVALLCRKRSQFAVLREALERRGVPVEVVGLGGLLSVAEVADVVATLRVLIDPTAGNALARLLVGPRWRLGPRDLVALGRRARALARGVDGQPAQQPDDPVLAAVSFDDTEAGSLVDALDDLGAATAYSEEGYRRLTALRGELRSLRGRLHQPLPDLVADVAHTLRLDVEVAARPGADRASALADLDAFVDAAAQFAGDEEEPTLRGFLAYLAAAQEEEFGLETGRVGSSDSVKLMTVHAAKGLEWSVVVVPGLSAGDRAQLFPAKPRQSTKWTDNARLVPFALRGDAADLPALDSLDGAGMKAFAQECADRDELEERRLAYVAVTRAARLLLASGFWWSDGKSPLGPGAFLQEIREALDADPPVGEIACWADAPADDRNPLHAQPVQATWPVAPSGPSVAAARVAAGLVAQARRRLAGVPGEADPPEPTSSARAAHDDVIAGWRRDADLLLAERSARLTSPGRVPVALPDTLSVSTLVDLHRDPAELARYLRRPVPRPPAKVARRGTAFHRWLETRYGQQRLLDIEELPGSADDGDVVDDDLRALQEAFERSSWWGREPYDVEVPFEALLAGVPVRGRMDAVFRDADGGWTVVDWKTGARPTGARAESAAVQLAAYRLAWAELTGAPLATVRAAFHYVRSNETVQPVDLLDASGLAALVATLPEASATRAR
jgi:DNA helicase-2/ATP-dependent DNA helicase PcrA